MKKINNFRRFSRVYENEEVQMSPEELIELAKKEMPLEDVTLDAERLLNSDNSDIQRKMAIGAQQMAQAQPEMAIRENYSGKDLMNPAALDILMKSALKRLPNLKTGSQIEFKGQMRNIDSAGVEYVPTKFWNIGTGYAVTYVDKNGINQDAYISYSPTEEECGHVKRLLTDLAEKSKWMDFVVKTSGYVSAISAVVGLGLLILGTLKFLYKTDQLVKSEDYGHTGSDGGFSWDFMFGKGGPELFSGVGLSALALGSLVVHTEVKEATDKFDQSVKNLTSILKAFLEPTGCKVSDLINPGDLKAVIVSNMALTMSKMQESKSLRNYRRR